MSRCGCHPYISFTNRPPARWGQPFLQESYLYHLTRLDHRHNFSPYFYLVYLTYPSASSAAEPVLWKRLLRSPLTSFVPQMTLALGSGLLFGRRTENLVFTWFVQTFVFVVFNKVCTSQVSLFPLHVLFLLILTRLMAVLSVVYALLAASDTTTFYVDPPRCGVWGGLDRRTSAMAE